MVNPVFHCIPQTTNKHSYFNQLNNPNLRKNRDINNNTVNTNDNIKNFDENGIMYDDYLSKKEEINAIADEILVLPYQLSLIKHGMQLPWGFCFLHCLLCYCFVDMPNSYSIDQNIYKSAYVAKAKMNFDRSNVRGDMKKLAARLGIPSMYINSTNAERKKIEASNVHLQFDARLKKEKNNYISMINDRKMTIKEFGKEKK